ncbi:hypothetical protein D8B25_22645, partial [Verminephrobacter aporrectodeae subsp. tuberculatae]|nr:hypothetical protein [Verminephrobacter aporrectodeae subsp. tuberculatae]
LVQVSHQLAGARIGQQLTLCEVHCYGTYVGAVLHMLGHLLGKAALVQFAALTDQAQRSVLRDLMAGNGDIEHLTA